MSIFWFPEPVSAYQILVDMGYLKPQGLVQLTGGREIIEIEVPIPRTTIEIKAHIVINDKYKKKEIFVSAYIT